MLIECFCSLVSQLAFNLNCRSHKHLPESPGETEMWLLCHALFKEAVQPQLSRRDEARRALGGGGALNSHRTLVNNVDRTAVVD